MGFKKGNKLGVSRKNKKNKKTLEWEEFGRQILESGLPRALEIMKTTDEENFMSYFTNLLEYFKPKLARTTLVGDAENPIEVNNQTVDVTKLSESSLREIADLIGNTGKETVGKDKAA